MVSEKNKTKDADVSSKPIEDNFSDVYIPLEHIMGKQARTEGISDSVVIQKMKRYQNYYKIVIIFFERICKDKPSKEYLYASDLALGLKVTTSWIIRIMDFFIAEGVFGKRNASGGGNLTEYFPVRDKNGKFVFLRFVREAYEIHKLRIGRNVER